MRADSMVAEREANDPSQPPVSPNSFELKPPFVALHLILAIVGAFFFSVVAASIASAIVGGDDFTAPTGSGGYLSRVLAQTETGQDLNPPGPSLSLLTILQVPLWLGWLGIPWIVAKRRGANLFSLFSLKHKPVDIPAGIVIGIATQFAGIPLYWLLSPILDSSDLSAPARSLAERATSPLSIFLLFVLVVVGAPLIEEIFFRGAVFEVLKKRKMSPALVVSLSALVFAVIHFQPLQFPLLLLAGIVFGYLYYKTSRLSLAIWAHVGFNLITVLGLLWWS